MGGKFQDGIDKAFKETTLAGYAYKKMKPKAKAQQSAIAQTDSSTASLSSRQSIFGSLTQDNDRTSMFS